MKLVKRSLLAVAMMTTLGVGASSASAALSPDPYSSSSDTGTVVINTPLGTARGTLTGVTGVLRGVAGGASGVISSITASAFSGYITSMTFLNSVSDPINETLVSGVTTTANVKVLVRNALGGQCLYTAASLRSTWTSPTSTKAAGGTLVLVRTLSGFCDATLSTSLSISIRGIITL